MCKREEEVVDGKKVDVGFVCGSEEGEGRSEVAVPSVLESK